MKQLMTILMAMMIAVGLTSGAQPALAQDGGTFYREVRFDSAKVVTADTTSAVATGLAPATLAGFQTVCVEDSGTATLDITIQRSIDAGTTWAAIVTFTQLSATGGQTSLYADVRSASPQLMGDRLRVNYDITGTGQYTCSVYGAFEA
jgi:hypothetical protein